MKPRSPRPASGGRFAIVATIGAIVALSSALPAKADPLAGLRWKSRVLVLVAPSSQDSELRTQRRNLEAASSGMFERNIVLMEAVGDGQQARQLRQRLAADGSQFRVFLVGKDGNTAFASSNAVAAKEIFGRIDAMPMRRDEMQKDSRIGG
jgi:hypothetical protein